jgi:uroporphyrinogen-III synthase
MLRFVQARDRPLDGYVIGVTADRRWEEQAELLRRRGAAVVHGAVLRTLPLTDGDDLRETTAALLEAPPDIVIANTGIGIRGWLSAAERWGRGDALLDMLRVARVLARGPKASGAIVTAGGHVEWRAPSGRLDDVVAHLVDHESVAGTRIALQLDGSECTNATDALRAAGADVIPLRIYRWTEPEDIQPAEKLADAVCAGAVDAVTFTSAPAVEKFLDLSGERDVLEAFAHDVVPVCIGPACYEMATSRGLERAVQPSRAVLGSMVNALTDALATQRRVVQTVAGELLLQGAAVVIDGARVELTDRERGVLKALARRPGTVVPKTVLLREVWGNEGADPHALEVTVGRLRRRLGDAGTSVRTIVRRGYQLATD